MDSLETISACVTPSSSPTDLHPDSRYVFRLLMGFFCSVFVFALVGAAVDDVPDAGKMLQVLCRSWCSLALASSSNRGNDIILPIANDLLCVNVTPIAFDTLLVVVSGQKRSQW